jgi:hypothetical protein
LGGEIWDEPVRGETFPPHLLGLSGIGQLRLFLSAGGVRSILTKLDLPESDTDDRSVLAVLRFLGAR